MTGITKECYFDQPDRQLDIRSPYEMLIIILTMYIRYIIAIFFKYIYYVNYSDLHIEKSTYALIK